MRFDTFLTSLKAHSDITEQSADSGLDCINTELGMPHAAVSNIASVNGP